MPKANRVLSTPPTNTPADPNSIDHRRISEVGQMKNLETITTAKLIEEFLHEIDPMEDDCLCILDYARVLAVMLENPDAGEALDGIRRLMHQILKHAENLKTQHDSALALARSLIAACEPATRL